MSNQGTTANKQGQVLENLVSSTLEQHGFNIVDFKKWIKDDKYSRVLIKNYPFISIYEGAKCKSEFLLIDKNLNLNIRIECKWQQVAGSVDEKFPYLIACCLKHKEPTIIVYGGGGAKVGAIKWLKAQQSNEITVQEIGEFVSWANKKFK